MGTFTYAGTTEIDIDDRTLAHLQIVLVNRLRRQESCAVTWNAETGSGRETLWVAPHVALRFSFTDRESIGPINRGWIEELTAGASRGDLRLTVEPQLRPPVAAG